MEKVQSRCAVCGGSMKEGFFLDFTKSSQTPTRWVEGKPDQTTLGYTAFSDRPNYHTSVFRCETCGHLELFAILDPPHKRPV